MTTRRSELAIKCKLHQFMWERGITISKVSEETGISRTTLTALQHNRAKGIQFQTLHLLLQYLECSFDDIFEVQFDV